MFQNPKDKVRIQHILEAIHQIEDYIQNNSYDNFVSNKMLVDATVRQLEVIGEATNHLSDEIKLHYSNVEWKQIIGLRNILIHEYFAVDVPLVWSVLQYDLPEFKNTILEIYSKL
jgi:uncharacterized protein with HEPN domain